MPFVLIIVGTASCSLIHSTDHPLCAVVKFRSLDFISSLDVVSEKEKFTVLHFMIHQKSTDVTEEKKMIVDTLLKHEIILL